MSPTDKEILDALSQEANKKKHEADKEVSKEADVELKDTDKTAESLESENVEKTNANETKAISENTDTSEEIDKSIVLKENGIEKKKEEPEEEVKEEEKPMTLLDHLKELRGRITRIVIVIFVGFFACYSIAEPVYSFLAAPLKANLPLGSSLIYTSPQGAFFVYMKVAVVLSFFLSSPFTFYQAWAFVAPGLYKEEKIVLIPLGIISALFFFGGASFCYFVVFPVAFNFFMGFATDAIVPMISIEMYLSFVLKLLVAFGLVFEMPLFAYFLGKMGLLTPERMRKWRKYAILFVFIFAAILTPPDIFSQTLMAIPMLILYEISIYVAAFANKTGKNAKNEEIAEPSETEK